MRLPRIFFSPGPAGHPDNHADGTHRPPIPRFREPRALAAGPRRDPHHHRRARPTAMGKKRQERDERSTPKTRPGEVAQAQGHTLSSYRLGALPILDRILQRLRLEEFLRDRLPPEDPRTKVPTATGLLLLLKNLLVSREPLYGVGEWAARFVPERLGLAADELVHLNDDPAGRGPDRLFESDIPSLALSVVAHAVREFAVELDELHNDSTTVTFQGAYDEAAEEA